MPTIYPQKIPSTVEIRFMNRDAIFLLLDCYHLLIHMPPVLKKITTTDMRLFILMHSLFCNVSS